MPDKTFLQDVYKLGKNPFDDRVSPINVEMVGRQKESQRWTTIIEERRGSSANTMCFIVGSYGSGKTLSLYRIIEQYKNDPEFLSVFTKMLPEDRVTKFGVDFIQRIFGQVSKEIYKKFRLQDLEALGKIYSGPARIFQRIALDDDKCFDFLTGQGALTASELTKFGINRKIDKTEVAKEYLLSFLFLLKGIGINTLLIAVDETEYVFRTHLKNG